MNIDPVDQALRTLDEMHQEHDREAPVLQLGIERVTRTLGRPWFAWVAGSFILVWIAVNIAEMLSGRHPFDRPPFQGLKAIASLTSLMMSIFILITQNRQNRIAHRRAEITLQIAVVTEQKVAKTIELLQELREDAPSLPKRRDREAEAMAQTIDIREAAKKVDEMGTTRA